MEVQTHLQHLLFTLLIAATIPLGCNSPTSTDEDKEESAKKSYVGKQAVRVMLQKVPKGAFASELVSNGKLTALEKAVVPFKVQEQMATGCDRVRPGDLQAKLDAYQYQKQLDDTRNHYEKARIDLEDMLLGYGLPENASKDYCNLLL